MTLYYSNPTSFVAYSAANTDQFLEWYSLQSIAQLVRSLRVINFSTQNGRNDGLGLITSIATIAPYRISAEASGYVDIRFGSIINSATVPPITYQAVAGFCDGWPEIFAALMNSLNYKDRVQQKTMLSNGGTGTGASDTVTQSSSTPDPNVSQSSYNDASQAFRWALSSMQNFLRNSIGVYSYVNFEEKYGLIWTTGANQPPDDPGRPFAGGRPQRRRVPDVEHDD